MRGLALAAATVALVFGCAHAAQAGAIYDLSVSEVDRDVRFRLRRHRARRYHIGTAPQLGIGADGRNDNLGLDFNFGWTQAVAGQGLLPLKASAPCIPT